MVRTLAQSHDELQAVAGRQAHVITLATGRTLARTIVADWLARYGSVLQTAEMRIVTRTLDETVHMLQRGEVSFALLYHHAAIAVRLDGRQFSYLTVMSDKLVPVARADAEGKPLFALAQALLPGASPCPIWLSRTAWRWGGWPKIIWPAIRCGRVCAAASNAIRRMPITSTCSRVWAWPGCPGPWCSATARTVVWRWPGTAAWTCISMCGFIGPNAA
jgi:hypothetical protein